MMEDTLDIKQEAARCLMCRNAGCRKRCPADTDVPAAMKLYRSGMLMEAGALLFENNPMSAITSRVCDWERLCMGHCVLNSKHRPVPWHLVEQEISSAYLSVAKVVPGADIGKKVAVVGGGPAGISAAIMLRKAGFAVDLYDENEQVGGVVRYGIPDFRLDKSMLDEYERILTDCGVTLHMGMKAGVDFDCEELARTEDAVLIAAGAWVPRKLGIPGEDTPKVVYALDYLRDPDSYDVHGKVIVVGGGNVTMDASRTAVRRGCDTWVYYRKSFENMPANKRELEEARLDGVQFQLFEVPVEIKGDIAVMRKCRNVIRPDGSIATKMIEGQDVEVSFDYMIVAISENVDMSIVPKHPENIFMAGDFATGPRTVADAVASAKNAVSDLIEKLVIN